VQFGHGSYGGLGLDDAITVLCLIVTMVSCIIISISIVKGLGQPTDDLTASQRKVALKWNVISNCVVIWSFSLPKFAIIAILKRILNYKWKTATLLWSLALSSQACILATSVWWFKQCTPVEYGWDKSIPGKCASTQVLLDLGYFTSAYSAFLDVFFAVYPIPFVMKLNMTLRTRIAVSSALSLSVLACVVSVYKLAIFGRVFKLMEEDPTCTFYFKHYGWVAY
jgi:hypothetical protein